LIIRKPQIKNAETWRNNVDSNVGNNPDHHLCLLPRLKPSLLELIQRDLTCRYDAFGKAPCCNQRPERGIWIGGYCLPLCARCMGLITGAIAGYLLSIHLPFKPWLMSLTVPLPMDVYAQRYLGITSTRPRRLITGLLFGVGLHGF
jgi:uncharacterized membrane protein